MERVKQNGRALWKNVLYASETNWGGVDTFHSIEAQSLKIHQSQLPHQKYIGVGKDYSESESFLIKESDLDSGAELEE